MDSLRIPILKIGDNGIRIMGREAARAALAAAKKDNRSLDNGQAYHRLRQGHARHGRRVDRYAN
jgi:hypothetical protein